MSQGIGEKPTVLACVTDIVSAHLSNNAVPVGDVPAFIRSVHATLSELEQVSALDIWESAASNAPRSGAIFRLSDVQPLSRDADVPLAGPVQQPAVPLEDSVQPGYIVCLEDGKRLRMLKRYLRTQFGLSPDDYRARWNLPADYPMAAPEVIEQRRTHAKNFGLGRKPAARKR